MLEMALNSAKLFIAGKLFQDNKKALRQMLLAIVPGAILLLVIAQFAPIWLAAVIAGSVSGFLQPILFKDLKYA
ncbi:MAG: hypothetical protein AAGF94_10655 [Pseudomonadota bacterium]